MKIKKFKGKLLVSDMDCTLLNSKYLISKKNIAGINYFVENGGLFTIATGRTEMAIQDYIKLLPINLPVIVSNGTKIFDPNKNTFIKQVGFSDDFINNKIKTLIDRFPTIGVEINNIDKVYFVKENSYTDYHKQRERFLYANANMDSIPKPWFNIYFLDEPMKIDLIEDFIKESNILENCAKCVRTEPEFLCIFPKNVSKGSALSELVKLYNLDQFEIFAIGDNMNDKEMLEFSDIGFAVLNANYKLKKYADFICHDNNHNALANVVDIINEFLKYSFIRRVS